MKKYFAVYANTTLVSEHKSMTAAAKAAKRLQSKSRKPISIQNYDGDEIKISDWESLAEDSIYESEVEYYKRNPKKRIISTKRAKKKAVRRVAKKATIKRNPIYLPGYVGYVVQNNVRYYFAGYKTTGTPIFDDNIKKGGVFPTAEVAKNVLKQVIKQHYGKLRTFGQIYAEHLKKK